MKHRIHIALVFILFSLVSCKDKSDPCADGILEALYADVATTAPIGSMIVLNYSIEVVGCVSKDLPLTSLLIVKIDAANDGNYVEIQRTEVFNTFTPGQTLIESELTFNIANPGIYRFEICVDPYNMIETRNEVGSCL